MEVLPAESAAFSKKRPVDPQSYETYLRALYLLNKRTPEALRSALREFQKAIDQDPTSALAWAGLADSYTLLVSQGEVPPRDAMPMAEAAVKKALQNRTIRWPRHTLPSPSSNGLMNGIARLLKRNSPAPWR